jgi:hypothetical protein
MEVNMARLRTGEKDQVTNSIFRLVRKHYNGLSEQEVANLAQMDRRRANNYLNELKKKNKIYKDGNTWYAE